ncbi:MAG: hypothetical protein SH820_17275 [Xanthomonadales bacterium]|nr:hypothetical protein [Xanthomonadales bacterium]
MLLVLLASFCEPLVADDEETKNATAIPSSDYLESHHAVIGEIFFDTENVFNPEIPGEDRYLYRLTNKLHITTRPKIVQRQLLFKTGDVFEQRLLDESERILRSNNYLKNAVIEPIAYTDGVVDLLVHTTDVWTLDPRLSFGRSGGENNTTFGIRDANILGTGIYFGLFHKSGVDRDENQIRFYDRELGSTRYALTMEYSDNSDGQRVEASYGRPFYALEAPRALDISLIQDDRIDSLYDRGDVQAEFRHQIDQFRVSAGISKGLKDGWVNRYSMGIQYDEHRFSSGIDETLPYTVIPADRKFIYPFVEWELLEDRFEKTRNHNQIGRTEDRYLGTRFDVRLGYASESLGSLNNAFLLGLGASTGMGSSASKSLLLSANYHTRLESGSLANSLLSMEAIYHHRQSDLWLLHAAMSGSIGSNLDLDDPLLLGGDNGLRGFPLRYQGGDSRALLTVEERLFTHWFPFRLIHVGAAVFMDVGRTWGNNPVGGDNLGWLSDVGFGFRFGNDRSGIGTVVHLDFAFPIGGESDISSVQVLLKGRSSF